MNVICEINSYEEITKLNIPTEMKDILLQKKSKFLIGSATIFCRLIQSGDVDALFNLVCAANGMGILSMLVLCAARGSGMVPYLNDKLRSVCRSHTAA
jgi:hypothetical protein